MSADLTLPTYVGVIESVSPERASCVVIVFSSVAEESLARVHVCEDRLARPSRDMAASWLAVALASLGASPCSGKQTEVIMSCVHVCRCEVVLSRQTETAQNNIAKSFASLSHLHLLLYRLS